MTAVFPGFTVESAGELLATLTAMGVELEANGQRLCFRPREKVTADLAARMKVHKAELLTLLQRREIASPTPLLGPRPLPLATPDPAMPEAWFRPGATAPRRDQFAYERETQTHPGWWDYLYEMHHRGLAVVAGKVGESPPLCLP